MAIKLFLSSSSSLYDQAVVCSTSFTNRAASSSLIAEYTFKPDRSMISFPCSALVPCNRTMIGTFISPILLYASTTPCATRSPRTMPPNILTRIAFTFGSFKMIQNASSTRFALADPPTSRKFAGSPPDILIISIVAIANPAPFTMHPTLPSNFT